MTRRHRPPQGFGRKPRIADLMTREYDAFLASSMAAERAGDAATALEYHRGIPMFRRSPHIALLAQLADVVGAMPPWAWARWAAYQCTRAEDPGTRSGEITRFAINYTVRMFHADSMQELYDAHDDPAWFLGLTIGQDWALHQLCTFELGGLEVFLDELAAGRLAEEAGLAREWLGCRMSGYRLERSGPLGLTACDVATGTTTDVLDLGADLRAGDFVIGRMVPSGTGSGWMFDTRPLAVDERTAREAAEGAGVRGRWVSALSDAIEAGRMQPEALRREDRELLTDVPSLHLVEAGTDRAALPSTLAALREGRDEVGRAAFRILRSVVEGSFGPAADAPYVGAAALNPHGFAEARRLLGPATTDLEPWAARVPEPARSRLRQLAAMGESAA